MSPLGPCSTHELRRLGRQCLCSCGSSPGEPGPSLLQGLPFQLCLCSWLPVHTLRPASLLSQSGLLGLQSLRCQEGLRVLGPFPGHHICAPAQPLERGDQDIALCSRMVRVLWQSTGHGTDSAQTSESQALLNVGTSKREGSRRESQRDGPALPLCQVAALKQGLSLA